jgi:DNA polymerase-3 subunit epsilon
VRHVEWTATGGEIGALLAEAKSVARLRPPHNRPVRDRRDDARGAAWPYAGAIAIEERDPSTDLHAWHVVDQWQYVGTAATLAEATALRAQSPAPGFELSTYRILSERLARGLAFVPLVALAAID